MTMTNNPTIDGVSREFADRLSSLKQEAQDLVWAIEECGSSVKLTDAVTKGSTLVRKIESIAAGLSAAPAVERQPAAAWIKVTDKGRGNEYELDWYSAAERLEPGEYELYTTTPEVAALQSTNKRLTETIQHMIDQTIPLVPDENNPMWTRRITIDELQSTIARLEARITQLESEKEFAAATYQAARDRIAELESGRGEPVTMDGKTTIREYVADSVPEDQIGDDWTKGYEECKRRIHRMFQQPVNACLDATAALKKSP